MHTTLLVIALLGQVPLPEALPEIADAGIVEVEDEKPVPWLEGDHLTGEWGGFRDWLAEHGFTIDAVYAGEVFVNAAEQKAGRNGGYIGHIDLAVTFDFEEAGLWPGGKIYVLGQTNHGEGINEFVGSTTEISNIEAPPYVQLGEFFFEQSLFGWLRFRLGKQDANREFGTPRFGGNFINNNFGMLPSSPLPSYPTNGLGAVVVVQPVWWINGKLGLFEGRPQIGSFGFDSALKPDAGHFLIASVNTTHHFGAKDKHQGTTTLGVFRQQGKIEEVLPNASPNATEEQSPRVFDEDYGLFFQNDERIWLNPADDDDPRCFTIITRLGLSQPDRNLMSVFFSGTLAYHGIGTRRDDTIGIGFGWFNVARPLNGSTAPGSEFFVEIFYKWRMTKFMSLQPDLQYYRTPGGDGRDALLVGARLKFKL